MLVVAALSAARSAAVRAGDYHDVGTLDCSQCHVMHVARPAVGASSEAPAETLERDVGPLLRRDVNELCLACHDGNSRAVDVLGRNQGRAAGDVRQAGFLNSLGRVGLETTGHTLGSIGVAPGSDPPWSAADESGAGQGLNCVHCHTPHGRQGATPAYRNLRSDAGNNALGQGLVTYNDAHPGVNDPSRDVFVRRALAYDESQVDFNEPDPRDSGLARFCAGCHDRFHGVPGVDAEIGGRSIGRGMAAFVRHPTAGVDIGAIGGEWSSGERFRAHANRVKVMSSSGTWGAPEGDATPTCISCHKAHGNDNPFGLIYRSGRGVLTENGDSQGHALEDLCGQCHATRSAFQ